MLVLKFILRFLIIIVFLLALLYAYSALTFAARPAHPYYQNMEGTQVIAHRGGGGERPENTMLAFQHAQEIGVDILEFDIQITRDEVLVVIHDDTVDRTTNGSGRVGDFTYEQLRQLDAGYHFAQSDPDGDDLIHPYRAKGLRIPSLEEVLADFSDLKMLIEIKGEETNAARSLCAIIREYNRQEMVLVSSFITAQIHEFRSVCPEVATSATESETIPFYLASWLGLDRAPRPAFEVLALPTSYEILPGLIGELELINDTLLASAALHGLHVNVWTINDVAEMQRLLSFHLGGIITDYPTRLLQILAESEEETKRTSN